MNISDLADYMTDYLSEDKSKFAVGDKCKFGKSDCKVVKVKGNDVTIEQVDGKPFKIQGNKQKTLEMTHDQLAEHQG